MAELAASYAGARVSVGGRARIQIWDLNLEVRGWNEGHILRYNLWHLPGNIVMLAYW